MSRDTSPLILTLRFDPASARFFTAQREKYYPPAINRVPAHATLFHQLPGEQERALAAELAALCGVQGPLPVRVEGLRNLGRGVAYKLESPALQSVRGVLARAWDRWLTPQDLQPYQPHITIQNKVGLDEARLLYQELSESFQPWSFSGIGLDLWQYLGGPWEHAHYFPFVVPDVSGANQCEPSGLRATTQ